MKIAFPKLKESSKPAFTLIELLVVIAIIGLLGGLVAGGATSLLRRQERVNAENTAYGLKTAISSYFTDYRKFPVESGTEENVEILSDELLMDVLLAADSEAEKGGLNPRKVVFFSGKAARRGGKQPDDESDYQKGVRLERDGGGILVDPYNNFYRIAMDLDYNNRVEIPIWDESFDTDVIADPILVWSKGRDNMEAGKGFTKDNIKTW